MGGLDLCFGRFEFPGYKLFEPYPGKTIWPGQDYNNVRIHDFVDVDDHERCLINKDFQPRMPWRDIACKLKGDVVKDLVRHFVQYWNYAKYCLEGTKKDGLLVNVKKSKDKGVKAGKG